MAKNFFEEILENIEKDGGAHLTLDGKQIFFPISTEKESKKNKKLSFHEKINQKFWILTSSDIFLEKVKKIKEKWNLPRYIKSEEDHKFNLDIKKICRAFKLSYAYQELVKNFVLNESVSENMLSAVLDYPAEFVVTPKSLKDHFVYIKVYPETTLNDVIDLWNGSFKHIKRKYFKCDNKKIERQLFCENFSPIKKKSR